jgi:hypothetical protein
MRWEHTFFPGFVTIVLAVIGAVALALATVRHRRAARNGAPDLDRPAGRRVFLWLLLLAGGVATLIAIGPEVRGVTMPFTFVHDVVPGFGGIRIPARLAVPGLLAGAVLAAVGFAAVTRRLRLPVRALVAVLVGGFMLAEFAVPFTHTELPDDPSTLAVYHALAKRPDGPVVELPVIDPARQGGAAWAYVEAPRMLYSTIDWNDRFNGYSGDWPATYLPDAAALNSLPSPEAIAAVRRLGIRYAVLHTGVYSGVQQYTEEQARAVIDGLPPGARATRHGNSWLIDFSGMR